MTQMRNAKMRDVCTPLLFPNYTELPWGKAVAAVHVLTLILAVCGNALVILAIVQNQRLRTITNYFILSLSIADSLVGVIGQPLLVFMLWNNHKRICLLEQIQYFFGSVSCGASGMLLCVVSVERYLSICKPFLYNQYLTEKRVFIIIINVWLTSITLTSLSFSNLDKVIYQSILLASFVIVLLVIIPCYALIYRTAVHHLARIESELTRSAAEQGKKQRKAALTILYVVVGFLFCWAPYFVSGFVWALYFKMGIYGQLLNKVYWVALTLGYANSCINPLLYTFNNREIKYGIMKQIMKLCGFKVFAFCCPCLLNTFEKLERELSFPPSMDHVSKTTKSRIVPMDDGKLPLSRESTPASKSTNFSGP